MKITYDYIHGSRLVPSGRLSRQKYTQKIGLARLISETQADDILLAGISAATGAPLYRNYEKDSTGWRIAIKLCDPNIIAAVKNGA